MRGEAAPAARLALAACLAAAVAGCSHLLVDGPDVAETGVADFDAAWAAVDSLYPPVLGLKGVDWDSVRAALRPRAEAARGAEVFQVVCDLVAAAADPHAYVQSEGGAVVYPYASRRVHRDRKSFSPYLVRRYVDAPLRLAGEGFVEYGFIEGRLGYLRLPTFDPLRMLRDFTSVMAALRPTDGLIIDVRDNNGGRRVNATGVVSWFIGVPLPYLSAIDRNGIDRNVEPPVEPPAGGLAYGRPVVVLINGATLSAGDIFAEFMRQIPGVTLLGDTTAGAACQDSDALPGDIVLPSGRRIHLPTRCALRFDGLLLDWFGVPPDVRVPQTAADILAGRDLQLETAIRLLRGEGSRRSRGMDWRSAGRGAAKHDSLS